MSVRRATVWVIGCDGPDCKRLAVPNHLTNWHKDAQARALHLSGPVDAFTAAEQAGWVKEKRGLKEWADYCPDHADVPECPLPIR